MNTLKNKLKNLIRDKQSLGSEGYIILNHFLESDLHQSFKDYNNFIRTLQIENEHGAKILSNEDKKIIWDLMGKYDIKPVKRDISVYDHIKYIHTKIFGDFE